ncbi:MAG: protein adenylyltransferase SelO [Hyphomonadaceae bacterium]
MPPRPAYLPDPLFETLGPDFADPVAPARFPALRLRWRNDAAAARVGLDALTPEEWEDAFARFAPLPGNMRQPLAMRYHGHQFRVYNPDLGDGRGFLYAQLRDGEGRLLDLGTKGSGQTPYSRTADGRLTLKGGVREILAAEMLEAQGVKTSKAFSLYETGEALQRHDEPSPTRAAVLVRLQHAHIRFGTFQRHAAHERPDLIAALIDHVGQAYYPAILDVAPPLRAGAMLEEIVRASARLAASWMSAGFVHGVLNTDNLVVTGESFDYGPWRFLPASIPGFTAAYFDQEGLYCFARQPEAVGWNLSQLAAALTLVSEMEPLRAALELYPTLYQEALLAAMHRRLGLAQRGAEDDVAFLSGLFSWMSASEIPWAQFFHDWMGGLASEARAARSPAASFYARPDFAPVRAGLAARAPVRPERLAHAYFQRAAPADLVIEEMEALWAPIAEADDWSAFAAKIAEIRDLKAALDIAVP